MEGIIIEDYFGTDNNKSNTNESNSNDKKDTNESKENKDNQDNNKTDQDLPNDMEIVRTEKTSKITIPQEIILDKTKSNELTQKLVEKTKRNAKIKLEEFFVKKRHYLIMSDGGKPVYSRYGDPIENNSIFKERTTYIYCSIKKK